MLLGLITRNSVHRKQHYAEVGDAELEWKKELEGKIREEGFVGEKFLLRVPCQFFWLSRKRDSYLQDSL